MNFYTRISRIDKNIKVKTNNISDNLLYKLKNLDLASINISEYNQLYLSKHISEYKKTAWFLSHIFSLVMEKNINLSNMTLVDYGGGSGVLSYYAKMLGVGTVIYNDIYDISCNDVQKISNKININIDHIVQGSIEELIEYIDNKNLKVDFLVSFDVIEHIYKVEDWFDKARNIKNDCLNIISTSHANKYNCLINNKLSKIQSSAEYKNKEKQWGHKERDSTQSFFSIRKEIIKTEIPNIEEVELNYLTKQTRGLIKQDIIIELEEYKKSGKIKFKPKHKSNTCDPLTGNWTEQFIDLKNLKKQLIKMNYDCNITPGFYIDIKGNTVVKFIKLIVNYIINILKFKGLFLSPYYVVYCKYKKSM